MSSALTISTSEASVTGSTDSDSSSTPSTPTSCTPLTPVYSPPGGSSVACTSSTGYTPGRPGYSSPKEGQRDFAHELPEALLAVGWRKFWSRRENRPYYFNKLTNKSSWEMPPHPQSQQHTHSNSSPGGPLKRAASGSEDSGPPIKRPLPYLPPHMPGALWDLSASSGEEAQMATPATPLPVFPPHPETELLRAQCLNLLRVEFTKLCQQRESLQPPPECFNRWLLERKISDRSPEPLFPADCPQEVSTCLFRELANALPVALHKVKFPHEARRQLHAYAEAARKLIESRVASAESRKTIKWNCEDTFQWLRKQKLPPLDDCIERLAHLKRQCQPHIVEVMKESLHGLCSKVYQRSREHAARIHERHLQLVTECSPAKRLPTASEFLQSGLIRVDVPLKLGLPCALLHSPAAVELVEDGDVCWVVYQQVRCHIQRSYLAKLRTLYEMHAVDDPQQERFAARLWCLLQRYNTYFGQGPGEGTVNQGALPIPVFETLRRCFSVSMELFASPLNCYFRQFCSAFSDTDCYFGSRGPFLSFHPRSGCYEANPPFCEEFMTACVDHMESLLRESSLPLSFVVVVPDFRDPPYDALIKMEVSEFNRRQVVIPGLEHEYRHGLQHLMATDQHAVRSNHATLLIFLQNSAGHTRYEPTEEKIKELVVAYQPRQDH